MSDTTQKTANAVYITFNSAGCFAAYAMLGASIFLSPIDLSTKGYWAMGILLLTLSLVNLVKYRFDDRAAQDHVRRLEDAKNERILKGYVAEN